MTLYLSINELLHVHCPLKSVNGHIVTVRWEISLCKDRGLGPSAGKRLLINQKVNKAKNKTGKRLEHGKRHTVQVYPEWENAVTNTNIHIQYNQTEQQECGV